MANLGSPESFRGWEAVTPRLKTESLGEFPHRGFVCSGSPEPLLPQKVSQVPAVDGPR